MKPNYVFMAIKEHPWGREMLSQLIDANFKPSLIIEEESKIGEIEREKFEFRIGNNEVGKMIATQAKEHNIPKETNQILKYYFIMFILFRIFDIAKPFPVSYYEKNFQNSFGVIMDDVCAGLYVVAILVLYMVFA